ncbi:hypothetical protein JZ751_019380 [Albula glossodonta]|uniref:ADAMTS/ADAMTS-like Spacer 1 domain-containing protein n=1 Tax=Albula glossodonta TaxID=121402 RepID=A0A8T2NUT0_9TELE|nr:hypothetical protein JZ751_019380 [Albula glossodonta]
MPLRGQGFSAELPLSTLKSSESKLPPHPPPPKGGGVPGPALVARSCVHAFYTMATVHLSTEHYTLVTPPLSTKFYTMVTVPLSTEYYTVVTVPAGARSIRVQEVEISTSYLAVRSLKKKYYLTGDWTVDWPGTFQFAGTVFDYRRSFNRPESLYAAGPTNETLVFEVRFPSVGPVP